MLLRLASTMRRDPLGEVLLSKQKVDSLFATWGATMRGIVVIVLMLLPLSALGQSIYKCSDGRGGHAYQQMPCETAAATKAEVRVSPGPVRAPAPAQPGAFRFSGEIDAGTTTNSVKREPPRALPPSAMPPSPNVQIANAPPSGFVRCVKPDGDSYLVKGEYCPERKERLPQRAGMVLDVGTGQNHFMVPGGGNAMIDPTTGERHELISAPRTRRVQDQAISVSRQQACAEERARRDSALSDRNRSIDSIRAAHARYDRMCK